MNKTLQTFKASFYNTDETQEFESLVSWDAEQMAHRYGDQHGLTVDAVWNTKHEKGLDNDCN